MTEVKTQKTVKILGLIFMIMFVLLFVAGFGAFLFYVIMRFVAKATIPPATGPIANTFMLSFMIEHIGVLSIAQALTAVLMFIASVQFTKFKPWARVVLEIYFLLFVLWTITFGLDFYRLLPEVFPWFALIVMSGCVYPTAFPFLVFFWLLNKKDLRAAFRR